MDLLIALHYSRSVPYKTRERKKSIKLPVISKRNVSLIFFGWLAEMTVEQIIRDALIKPKKFD